MIIHCEVYVYSIERILFVFIIEYKKNCKFKKYSTENNCVYMAERFFSIVLWMKKQTIFGLGLVGNLFFKRIMFIRKISNKLWNVLSVSKKEI